MSELILTLLSQNTADYNSGHAFSRLLQRFPDWQSVLDAPVSEVEDAIRPGRSGADQGAAAAGVAVRGERTLAAASTCASSKTCRLDQAREWLRTLPGVGPKTAACVLLFGMGRPGLPVDTHVHRVSMRLA